MEYTIKKLAEISGVTSRTLRYYDQIDLLKPKRISSSGYRIYGRNEVDRLQQILFLKRFGIRLEEIGELLATPDFEIQEILKKQLTALTKERDDLNQLLQTLTQTIRYYEGDEKMTDQEKFDTFKQQKVTRNEEQYGSEIREKYGDQVVDTANQKWLDLTKEQFAAMQQAEKTLFDGLNQLLESEPVDLDSQTAKEVFDAHKKWLTITAPFYNADYHRGLADMYVNDERFAKYYNDRTTKDSVQLIHDIIYHYAN